MSDLDLVKRLPIITEFFTVGAGAGRRAVIKTKHLQVMMDMICTLANDLNKAVTDGVNPTVEDTKNLVKVITFLGRVRASYIQRVQERVTNERLGVKHVEEEPVRKKHVRKGRRTHKHTRH